MSEARQQGTSVAVFEKPRLPYHPAVEERFGVDRSGWKALTDAVFPLATTADSIVLALSYCRARRLDPFKRVVHIVPVWSKQLKRMVDTIWPGIGELRTTAFRTGEYAGRGEAEFGPDHTEVLGGKKVTYPEWCRITVFRKIKGERVEFVGPKVYWRETYATAGRDSEAPNDMWNRRPRGQLEKCAEAAALRAAFPEEMGDEATADEMHGQVIDTAGNVLQEAAPPRPKRTDFGPSPAEQRFIEAVESGEFTGDVANEVAAEMEPHDPQTGEITDPPSDPNPAPASAGELAGTPAANGGASEASEREPAGDEFWQRPSLAVEPKRKGKGYDWPAWEAEILGRAQTAPGIFAAGKLRADNTRPLGMSQSWNPGHAAFVAKFDALTVPPSAQSEEG